MKDKEKIYDEKIFPLMKQILEITKKEDIPFFATFQYADNSFCSSFLIQGDYHPLFDFLQVMYLCGDRCSVNIDKFLLWVIRRAMKTGHSSIYLQQLGIPHLPEKR